MVIRLTGVIIGRLTDRMLLPKKTADTKTACSVPVEATRCREGKKLKRFW